MQTNPEQLSSIRRITRTDETPNSDDSRSSKLPERPEGDLAQEFDSLAVVPVDGQVDGALVHPSQVKGEPPGDTEGIGPRSGHELTSASQVQDEVSSWQLG